MSPVKLSLDRFGIYTCWVERFGQAPALVNRYTYESHDKAYEIDLYADGTKVYKVNCLPGEPQPLHAQIVTHFGLDQMDANREFQLANGWTLRQDPAGVWQFKSPSDTDFQDLHNLTGYLLHADVSYREACRYLAYYIRTL